MLLLAFFLNFSFSIYFNEKGLGQGKVIIKDAVVWVGLARTSEEKSRGLSGRESLAEDEGLLFVFDKKDFHSFWMKDMNFPLDIIWIADNKIVGIVHNALVSDNINGGIPAFLSPEPVNYVLEVNAGFCEKNYIQVNDEVLIQAQ